MLASMLLKRYQSARSGSKNFRAYYRSKPVLALARKSISNFKIREGMAVGGSNNAGRADE